MPQGARLIVVLVVVGWGVHPMQSPLGQCPNRLRNFFNGASLNHIRHKMCSHIYGSRPTFAGMQDVRKVFLQEIVIVSSPAAADHNGAIPTSTFPCCKLWCQRLYFMNRYEPIMINFKGIFSKVSDFTLLSLITLQPVLSSAEQDLLKRRAVEKLEQSDSRQEEGGWEAGGRRGSNPSQVWPSPISPSSSSSAAAHALQSSLNIRFCSDC